MALLPIQLAAQVGTIQGEVRDQEGRPAPVTIEATREAGGVYLAVTNQHGTYILAGLPAGTYTVTCQVADILGGYRTQRDNVIVTAGAVVTVNFTVTVTLGGGTPGATPTVSSVTNGASYTMKELPSYGIAQGSLFVVKGKDMGPANLEIATTFPLRTTLGGTVVTVLSGGSTYSAILYYASATQVAAILPSTTPPGNASLTVTYGGRTSASFAITVVRSAIGVFTVNQSGAGDAIATLGAGFVGPLNAANPGDVVTLWATGLGPVNFDESAPAQQRDMTEIPIEAWVGGRRADVVFRGRNACCSSVDTIYVRIPAGVGACITPVVFKTGDYISNTTTISTASTGRTCTPTLAALSTNDVQTHLSKSTISYGGFTLYRSAPVSGQINTLVDTVNGTFARDTPFPNALGFTAWDLPHMGSCNAASGASFITSFQSSTSLDAGNLINVTGASGTRSLQRFVAGNVIGYSGLLDNPGAFFNPGNFTVTSSGAPAVGAFSASIPFPPLLNWTNQNAIATVDRAGGVTVNWSGGAPDGLVFIQGFSTAQGNPAAGAQFMCIARASDGSFTVPPYVTMTMPPSTPTVAPAAWPASLWVSGFAKPVQFSAAGLDFAVLGAGNVNLRTVTYGGSGTGGGGGGGSPLSITSFLPATIGPGETRSINIRGTGLSTVSNIEFSPADGITVTQIRPAETLVTAQVTVAANAATGSRQVLVVNPQGRSNSLSVTISSSSPTR